VSNLSLEPFAAGVRHWRDIRKGRILASLDCLNPNFKVAETWKEMPDAEWAVLNQVNYALQRLVNERVSSPARDVLGILERGIRDFPVLRRRGLICADSETCRKHDDERFELPAFTLEQAALSRPARSKAVLAAALPILTAADPCGFCAAQPGAIVALQFKSREEVSSSYTLSGLFGTIYADFSDSALRNAESVLHESVHCWFNEAMASLGASPSPEAAWYSPWKGCLRPASAFLHAALTFSVLVSFWMIARDLLSLTDWDRAYAADRMASERTNLSNIRHDFQEAVSLLPDVGLRDFVRSCYEQALDERP
jgi:HEXXH motif-containing protein